MSQCWQGAAGPAAVGPSHTFTGLSVGVQGESALTVAVEAPRSVLADAVGAAQVGI